MKQTQPTLRLRREVIQALREVRDLDSDRALAEAMGVSQSSVSRVLRGGARPGPQFIAGLCLALQAPIHKLVEIDD